MHHEFPPVVRLDLPLPGQQTVVFKDNATLQHVANNEQNTKLTAWFSLCLTDPAARQHLYMDLPSHYTWDSKHTVRHAPRASQGGSMHAR